MRAEPRRSRRPDVGNIGAADVTVAGDSSSLQAGTLADVDAQAERLRGRLVVQVAVGENGHRRTTVYRSAEAAERAVIRARERGRTAHVSLVQMLPVGVVVGLGGGGAS